MATIVLAPYSPNHFQSIPTLEVAKTNLLSTAKGENLVKTFFKDFFVEAGMDRTLGFVMLHRHFDLEDDEKTCRLPWDLDYLEGSCSWNEGTPGLHLGFR